MLKKIVITKNAEKALAFMNELDRKMDEMRKKAEKQLSERLGKKINK